MRHLNLQTTILNRIQENSYYSIDIIIQKNQNISRVFLKFNKKGKQKNE